MKPLALFLALMILPAMAEDWTVNGKDYHNVKVTQVDSDRVHIIYDGGVGTVALADLPSDLQTRFGYDAIKAKAAAREVCVQMAADSPGLYLTTMAKKDRTGRISSTICATTGCRPRWPRSRPGHGMAPLFRCR